MSELLPCPFCLNEYVVAEPYSHGCGETRWRVACASCGCRMDGGIYQTEWSAVKAWNDRNGEKCFDVEDKDDFFWCSNCGCEVMLRAGAWHALYMGDINFCPNCGARVTKEVSADADR